MTTVDMESRLNEHARQHMADNTQAFDALLRVTLTSLKALKDVEAAWRDALRRGEVSFTPESESLILNGYRDWLREAQVRKDQLVKQQSIDCNPPLSDEFLRSLEEIEDKLSMLTRAELGAEARRQMAASDNE